MRIHWTRTLGELVGGFFVGLYRGAEGIKEFKERFLEILNDLFSLLVQSGTAPAEENWYQSMHSFCEAMDETTTKDEVYTILEMVPEDGWLRNRTKLAYAIFRLKKAWNRHEISVLLEQGVEIGLLKIAESSDQEDSSLYVYGENGVVFIPVDEDNKAAQALMMTALIAIKRVKKSQTGHKISILVNG